MYRSILKVFLLALLSASSSAFVVTPNARPAAITNLKASEQHNEDAGSPILPNHLKAAAFTTLVTMSQPLMALAEADDYEYGAVDAPPFVPIIGGILAILTALLPIALRSGEEAFEEMKDEGNFGTGKDVLKSRK
jgi:hypothetical protein